jgi:DNA-binding IclR family transcriptional regulator
MRELKMGIPASVGHTPSVTAASRCLLILETVAGARSGLTLSQLTRKIDAPKSTVHCLLVTLERTKYLQRDDRSRYLIGPNFLELMVKVLGATPLRVCAMPHLRALMDSTGLTVHMAMLMQGEVVLIERMAPSGSRQVPTWIGKRMAAHCTGLGKVLMAYLPEEELSTLIVQRGLLRYNDNTICSTQRLKDELERVRRLGFALDDEEEEIGARCIGTPILDSSRHAIAAISVSGTTDQIRAESLDKLVAAVQKAARMISNCDPEGLPAQEPLRCLFSGRSARDHGPTHPAPVEAAAFEGKRCQN